MNKRTVLFLAAFSWMQVWAQTPAEELAFFAEKYPGAGAVALRSEEHIDVQLVGDSLVVTEAVYTEVIYLTDNPAVYANESIYSSSFRELVEKEAYTLVPGKKKYDKVPVTQFKETFNQESHVFYDDSREVNFKFPSLMKGGKTVVSYKRQVTNPHMLGLFYFQSYLPVHETTFAITYDPRVEVNPQIFNDATGVVTVSRKTLPDGRKEIRLSANALEKLRPEGDSPSFGRLALSAYFQIMNYQLPTGQKRPVLGSVADLMALYQGFTSKLELSSASVDSLVQTLITPQMAELEKVRTIYYWVQANIKYIAFEDGMRGFVPHSGSYVLAKRYGDCKDMSSLLVTMLRSAGIEVYHTWIGTRDIPFLYTETPAPIVDNHMIATCRVNDEWYFLDATGSYTPLGLPTSMIQGKQCLIDRGEAGYEVLEVPVIAKEQNVMYDSVYFRLEKRALVGSGKAELTGYAKVFNSYRLIKKSQKSVDDYVKYLLAKGSNKFQMKSYQIGGLENLDVPTSITYDFSVPDYYSAVGDQVYVNLVLDQSLMDYYLKSRKVALENEYNYINRSISVLELPEGMEVEYLPESVSKTADYFGFSVTYERQGRRLIARKEFYVDYFILSPEQFPGWDDIIRAYSDACKNTVVLTKKSN